MLDKRASFCVFDLDFKNHYLIKYSLNLIQLVEIFKYLCSIWMIKMLSVGMKMLDGQCDFIFVVGFICTMIGGIRLKK